jgi:hypothetical protein
MMYPVFVAPTVRQAQMMMSKKAYFRRKRLEFNNKSLYQKNLIRKGLRALDRLTSKK